MIEERKFQRTIENFSCGNCGAEVCGTGYTNHCPKCLYSKHVDVNPGDRAAACCGLMKPIVGEKEGAGYRILHKCEKCGFERFNKLLAEDSFEAFISLFSLAKPAAESR